MTLRWRRNLLILATAGIMTGCEAGMLIGGMMQNYEYQKKIQVLPEYSGLENSTVAVIVDADLATLYEHPDLVTTVTGGVTARIGRHVEGVHIMHPDLVMAWQYHTPQWNGMPYGEIADALNVDRVVYIDIFEYRLNPPGNRWEWEAVLAANVGVIERGSFAPDSFADSFTVVGQFPRVKGLTREEADTWQIERGVLTEFVTQTAWLFHEHERPKYPDKYRAQR